MVKRIEPSDSVENYLQHKLGISQSLASAFFKVIAEFISLKLRRRQVAVLPYFGKLTLKVTPKAKRMVYNPGQSLKNRINEELGKESTFIASIQAIKEKLNLSRNKDNNKEIQKIEEELRTERRPIIRDERDVLRYSLIYYFQRLYPHNATWTHPKTRKIYDWDKMHGAISAVKEYSWRDYKTMLTTLIRIDDRRSLLLQEEMTMQEYHKCLQRALDAILMLLEFDLSQSELKSILESDEFKL